MIILAPKMYFGVSTKSKSVAKAKTALIKKFNLVDQVNQETGKKEKFIVNRSASSMVDGLSFIYDFVLDNPVGVTFTDLYDIYNSIPKNLIDGYNECIKGMEKLDPNNEKDDEKYWFYNMKAQEYSSFIEDYLNNLRKEAEEERSEVMKMIEDGENGEG